MIYFEKKIGLDFKIPWNFRELTTHSVEQSIHHERCGIRWCWIILRLAPTGGTVMKQWWNSDEIGWVSMKQDESERWNSDETCWIRMNQQWNNLFHGRETPWNKLNQDETWSWNTLNQDETVFHGHEKPWIRIKHYISWSRNTLFNANEILWIRDDDHRDIYFLHWFFFHGVSLRCFMLFHAVSCCFTVFHCAVSCCFIAVSCCFVLSHGLSLRAVCTTHSR